MVAPRTNIGGATAHPGFWLRTNASVPASPLARLHTGVPHTLVSESLAGRSARSSRVGGLTVRMDGKVTARARCRSHIRSRDSESGGERGNDPSGINTDGPRSHREVVHESPALSRRGWPHTPRASSVSRKMGARNTGSAARQPQNRTEAEHDCSDHSIT